MKPLDFRDDDGDRLVLSDFNDDVPESARQPSKQTEALLRVHQYTALDGELPEGVDPEEGMAILLGRDHAESIIEWFAEFFDIKLVVVPEAKRDG